jgi:DNA polymerase-4
MRIILHVDMDAFYASIEQRERPELRGEPVIVGGSRERGVVATCSYEARPYGVHSAQPMSEALEKCPDAVVVEPRMSLYAEVSREIMEILGNYTPVVEKLSLDEAFLDMSGSRRLFGQPREMAAQIRADIQEETDLTASVGIAKNKFLAKLASDLDKPDGVTEIPRGSERDYIAPMDVGKIWGVGPKAKQTLNELGLETIGDVAEADEGWLRGELGNFAGHIQSLARGEDDRPVVADSQQKSVGSEGTLRENIRGASEVADQLRSHCQTVARELRKKELKARGVRVKVRYDDTFSLATRQVKLPTAADDSKTLFETAKTRLSELDLTRPIRLVGAAAYDLVDADEAVQADLFASSTADQESELEHTLDAIREKFGDKIGRGDG